MSNETERTITQVIQILRDAATLGEPISGELAGRVADLLEADLQHIRNLEALVAHDERNDTHMPDSLRGRMMES